MAILTGKQKSCGSWNVGGIKNKKTFRGRCDLCCSSPDLWFAAFAYILIHVAEVKCMLPDLFAF